MLSSNALDGVQIAGPTATGNVVEGDYIGTDFTGVVALGNGTGVEIDGAATDNTIGGTTAAAGNVISGNTGDGVEIDGTPTSNNLIEGNEIGTNPAGTAALPNGGDGVEIDAGPTNNTVGGTTAAAGNLISGNTENGVEINGTTSGNVIEGDDIGTVAGGTAALANGTNGVEIDSGATANTIGGTTTTLGTGTGNVISGNAQAGILITGTATVGNLVEGNLIGTDAAGTAALPNDDGVAIVARRPWRTRSRGTAAGSGNVISGNTAEGVSISGSALVGNLIEGDFIGTDITGTGALGNGDCGIVIASLDNQIGGTTSGAGNVIGGNTNAGVSISGAAASITLMFGNDIGTNSADDNQANGVGVILNAPGNTIGGTDFSSANTIGFNTTAGVSISGAGATGDVVLGNFIGEDLQGNNIGNGTGVILESTDDTIGGSDPGAGTYIGNNTSAGISISGQGATANLVLGNIIGADGLLPEANQVVVVVNSPGNTIGGTANGDVETSSATIQSRASRSPARAPPVTSCSATSSVSTPTLIPWATPSSVVIGVGEQRTTRDRRDRRRARGNLRSTFSTIRGRRRSRAYCDDLQLRERASARQ